MALSVVAIKKSEIYASLWKSCDELRGGMDASQYKDYVLVLLFVKYVSDKYYGKPSALIKVPEGCSFADMVKLDGDKEIGDKINGIVSELAKANCLSKVIDVADFNDSNKLGSGKKMVDRLSSLVAIFNSPELDFRENRAVGDDILGDAYEYMMRHFATESGKSKGQFYTPAEVSRVMAKVIGMREARCTGHTIYDPTCGSGSLLLKANDEAGAEISIYGQERDNATRALAHMNMILHGSPTAVIEGGNTLAAPHFKDANGTGTLKTFDFAVANPPFSNKTWRNDFDPDNDEFKRFEDGIPPAKNGDYAFLLHVLASLKSTGKGAIILPHGVLFRSDAEADIRRKVARKGYIKGIIGLPPNLFYGTSIPACIIVIDKEHAAARTGIFMVDASKGFEKDGSKNRLRAQDIHKIVDAFVNQAEVDQYSRMVSFAEIETEKYNLNIRRYIDASEPEDIQDIDAHLQGGIPEQDVKALDTYWRVMPSVRTTLFDPASRPGYFAPKVEAENVTAAIRGHPDFAKFATQVIEAFATWRGTTLNAMRCLGVGTKPKAFIHDISESLLNTFKSVPLIDKYDIYQHLMSYWASVMQDDVYQIAQDNWKSARTVRELEKNKDSKLTEKPDLVIGTGKNIIHLKADIIPSVLVIAHYFSDEQAKLNVLETDVGEAARAIEELKEEHCGEDGLLADALTDKGKLTAASVKACIKNISHAGDTRLGKIEKQITKHTEKQEPLPVGLKKGVMAESEELRLFQKLQELRALLNKEAAAKKAYKKVKGTLNKYALNKYAAIKDEDIKKLVVEDKWLASVEANVRGDLDRVAQTLTSRVKLLTERYATPLPSLIKSSEAQIERVREHLVRMGFVWN